VNLLLALTVGLTRGWTAAYTSGLPAAFRGERRDEIDSDLWEQRTLAARRGDPAFRTAVQVLARMSLGILSDISWRAQAGAYVRADRSLTMTRTMQTRSLVAAGIVAAFLYLFIATGIGAIVGALITIPLLIAFGAFALGRARRTGGAVRIGADRMRTEGESRWKRPLGIIVVSVASLVGLAAYAFSLEEWGAARTMIFNLGGMVLIAAALIATVILVSDLVGSARRKSDTAPPLQR